MQDKNILITGASQGIGKAIAYYLSSKGYHLVLVARNKAALETIQNELKEKVLIYSYDLQNLENIEDIFSFCKENNVKLNGMVHCAGINRDTAIRCNNIKDMNETMTVNYMSFVELSKYFLKKKYSYDESSIIAISSHAVNKYDAGMSVYTSSKAALEATMKVLAKEGVKRGIRANTIAPACVDTEMIENAPMLTQESIMENQPLGLINPIYIAYLAEFLLSEKAKYITGISVPITAGQ